MCSRPGVVACALTLGAAGCGRLGYDGVANPAGAGGDAASGAPAVVLDSLAADLVAWWPLDERTGQILADVSGQHNDATLMVESIEALAAPGRHGGALRFHKRGWAVVPASPSLAFTDSITVALWFQHIRSPEGVEPIIDREEPGSQLGVMLLNGLFTAHLGTDSPPAMTASGRRPLPIEQWTPVVATWDGARLRLFVNGEERGGGNEKGRWSWSDSPLYLGTSWDTPDRARPMTCGVDEVLLWRRVLSDDEVRAFSAGALPPRP